jgi:predicted nicotinamide N-methyase
MTASFPETPLDALGPTVRETVLVEGRSFVICRPGESDRLLENPAVQAVFAADDYLPFWSDLWPAARMLAKYLLKQTWPKGLPVLEIGCGLGLPGVVALSLGLRVTFSDCDRTALRFAADNARANGFADADFELLPLDWRNPPADRRFPLVLGSDLVYELRHVPPLVGLIKHVLTPDGVCLLTDQDRVPTHVLRETLAAEGLPFTTQPLRAGEPGGRRVKGTLYRITLPGGD